MYRGKITFLTLVKLSAMVGLVVALVALSGCSCKKQEEQIAQLDSQIADLQQQLSEKDATNAECEEIASELRENLQQEKAENAVLIEKMNEVVYISVRDEILFGSSQTMVLDTMESTLEVIANTVRQHPDWDVMVAGHTDNRKIMEEFQVQWPSNWELGAFRSAAVVRYMTHKFDLPADRMAVMSYGPFYPVASNDSEEGRAQNRRVTFILHKPEEMR